MVNRINGGRIGNDRYIIDVTYANTGQNNAINNGVYSLRTVDLLSRETNDLHKWFGDPGRPRLIDVTFVAYNGTSSSVAALPDHQEGDLLVYLVLVEDNVAQNPPSGYTEKFDMSDNANFIARIACGYKVANSSETNPTISHSGGGSYALFSVRNANTINLVAFTSPAHGSNAESEAHANYSYTVNNDCISCMSYFINGAGSDDWYRQASLDDSTCIKQHLYYDPYTANTNSFATLFAFGEFDAGETANLTAVVHDDAAGINHDHQVVVLEIY